MKINDFEKYMQIKLGRVEGGPLTRFRLDKAKGKPRKQTTCLASKWPKIKPNWTGAESELETREQERG